MIITVHYFSIIYEGNESTLTLVTLDKDNLIIRHASHFLQSDFFRNCSLIIVFTNGFRIEIVTFINNNDLLAFANYLRAC